MYVLKLNKLYFVRFDTGDLFVFSASQKDAARFTIKGDVDPNLPNGGARFVKLKPKAQPTGLQGTAPGHELD